jgi:tripartite-type tricarboxylate transporter receptor subunit TctC
MNKDRPAPLARRTLLAAGAAMAIVRPVRAADRVTLLVGANPGTRADIGARDFAPFLSRALAPAEAGVRDLPGEAGLTALLALADAPASGALYGWVAAPTLPARMADRDCPGLLSRLTLLGAVQKEPVVFVCPAASPLETMQELVRRSGEDADAVPLGTPPPGSPPHLAALRLQTLAGTRLNIVTFPSALAARQAVAAGNVAAAALGMAEAIGLLRAEKLVGLGVAAGKRSGAFPDMPALQEAGLPLSAFITRGLAAPSALPAEQAARMAGALQAVAHDPAFRAKGQAEGFHAVWLDGAAWTRQVADEHRRLAELWAREPWLPGQGQ